MAQLSAAAVQIVEAGRDVVFTSSFIAPNEMGFILPNPDESGLILRGVPTGVRFNGCCCNRNFFAEYYALFSANIAIPTGGTAGEISIAVTVNGSPVPAAIMITTPAAVEEFESVSTQVLIPIPIWGTQNIAVENTSDQAISVQNANLTVFMPEIGRR